MARHLHSESTTLAFDGGSVRSQSTLWVSLALFSVSFMLLLAAPLLFGRFHSAALGAQGFLPSAAAAGVALGGGAAMLTVLSRLVRDVETHPFSCLSPVLAVFAGFLVWGLRAQVPLEGVSAEHVGMFGLALSVVGGSLIDTRGSFGVRIAGWLLCFFAPVTLLLLLWTGSNQAHFGAALASLGPKTRLFAGLMFLTSLAIAVVGEASRALRRLLGATAQALPAPPQVLPNPSPAVRRETQPLFPPPVSRPVPQYGPQAAPQAPLYAPHVAPLYAPRVAPVAPSMDPDTFSTLALDDADLSLLRPKRSVLPWLGLLLLAAGAGLSVYLGVIKPRRDREEAARAAVAAAHEQARAEQKRAEAEQRSGEAKAARERLEAMLERPAPSPVAASAESEPAATDGPQPAQTGEAEAAATTAAPAAAGEPAAMAAARSVERPAAHEAVAESNRPSAEVSKRAVPARNAAGPARAQQRKARPTHAAKVVPEKAAPAKRAPASRPVAAKKAVAEVEQPDPLAAPKGGVKKGPVMSEDDPLFGL